MASHSIVAFFAPYGWGPKPPNAHQSWQQSERPPSERPAGLPTTTKKIESMGSGVVGPFVFQGGHEVCFYFILDRHVFRQLEAWMCPKRAYVRQGRARYLTLYYFQVVLFHGGRMTEKMRVYTYIPLQHRRANRTGSGTPVSRKMVEAFFQTYMAYIFTDAQIWIQVFSVFFLIAYSSIGIILVVVQAQKLRTKFRRFFRQPVGHGPIITVDQSNQDPF